MLILVISLLFVCCCLALTGIVISIMVLREKNVSRGVKKPDLIFTMIMFIIILIGVIFIMYLTLITPAVLTLCYI